MSRRSRRAKKAVNLAALRGEELARAADGLLGDLDLDVLEGHKALADAVASGAPEGQIARVRHRLEAAKALRSTITELQSAIHQNEDRMADVQRDATTLALLHRQEDVLRATARATWVAATAAVAAAIPGLVQLVRLLLGRQ